MSRRTKVLAFGTFDFLHPGHLAYLEWAKQQGGRNATLTVVVGRDANVRRLKGHQPFFSERERLQMIRALALVDHARLGLNGKDRYRMLALEKPDVVCLGYDQKDAAESIARYLTAHGLKARVVRAKGKRVQRFKSSKVRGHYRL